MSNKRKLILFVIAVLFLATGLSLQYHGYKVAALVSLALFVSIPIGIHFVNQREFRRKEKAINADYLPEPIDPQANLDVKFITSPGSQYAVQKVNLAVLLNKLSTIQIELEKQLLDAPRLPETASWIPEVWGQYSSRIMAFVPKVQTPFDLTHVDLPINPAYAVSYFYYKALGSIVRLLEDIPGPEARSVKEFLTAGSYKYVSDTLGLHANSNLFYNSEIPLTWCIWALTESVAQVMINEVWLLSVDPDDTQHTTRGVLLSKIETEYRRLVNIKIAQRVETIRKMDLQDKAAQQNKRFRAKRMAKRHRRRN